MTYQVVSLGVEGVGQGLLMHNPASMRAAEGDAKPARSGKKIPAPMEEALQALYIMPGEDQLYAAPDWFREAALVAAKEFKDRSRRGNATMVQRFSASVFQSDLYFPLWRAEEATNAGKPITSAPEDWEIFLKRVVVQGNGIVRARPLIRDWACDVEFEYDDETIEPVLIAPIVNTAGKFPGIGDYRPGKKGPFGRYRVISLNGEPWEAGK